MFKNATDDNSGTYGEMSREAAVTQSRTVRY